MLHFKTIISLLVGGFTCLPIMGSPSEEPEKHDSLPLNKVADVTPAPAEQFEKAFDQAAKFLIENQLPSGAWGDHTKTKGLNVFCPYPTGPSSFQTSSTALCVIGLESSPISQRPDVKEALQKAEDFIVAEAPKIKRGDTMSTLNVWAYSYTLSAISLRASKLEKDSPHWNKLKDCATVMVKRLSEFSDAHGGWGYYNFDLYSKRPAGSPTSFLTATALLSARQGFDEFDLKLSDKVLARALKFLASQRTPAGTYVYSRDHTYHQTLPINRHAGSLARNTACDLALRVWGNKDIVLSQIEDQLERLWSRSGWLSMALKKPVPHESFAANAGYFFYYGYYYAARCMAVMPDKTNKRHAAHLADDLLPLQEKNGCWWDYPLYNYHKFYGTGYALYSLSEAWNILYGSKPAKVTTDQ